MGHLKQKKLAQMLQLYDAPLDRFSQDAQKIVSMFIVPKVDAQIRESTILNLVLI